VISTPEQGRLTITDFDIDVNKDNEPEYYASDDELYVACPGFPLEGCQYLQIRFNSVNVPENRTSAFEGFAELRSGSLSYLDLTFSLEGTAVAEMVLNQGRVELHDQDGHSIPSGSAGDRWVAALLEQESRVERSVLAVYAPASVPLPVPVPSF
jgi:hypothetical protein